MVLQRHFSNTWQKAAVGCPPPPNCAESGSSDAQPADASADITAAGDSSGDGSASCLGSVTFHIAAGTSATYCGQGPCSTDFVTVLNSSGQTLKIKELSSNPCSIIDCSSCRPADSCLCDGGYRPLPVGGLDVTWLGAVWSPSGTCGSSVACEAQGCARAGLYTAHVCSLVGPVDAATCDPQTGSVCVDVPCMYPDQATVVVTLP
jgi:hypothetical protein